MLDVAVKGKRGVFDLDVKFESRAEVTALFGASGSGKTSILHGICGHWRPDRGHIRLGDVDLFVSHGQKPEPSTDQHSSYADVAINMPVHLREIGAVFQAPLLFPHMNVRKNLLYSVPMGSNIFEAVVSTLDLGGLLNRMPHNLSGGEAQRVALGRALISQPKLLLLDEPLTGLDDARRESVFPYLERLCEAAKIPVIYVSHNRLEIERLAQRVLIVDSGRIIGDMLIEEFRKQAG